MLTAESQRELLVKLFYFEVSQGIREFLVGLCGNAGWYDVEMDVILLIQKSPRGSINVSRLIKHKSLNVKTDTFIPPWPELLIGLIGTLQTLGYAGCGHLIFPGPFYSPQPPDLFPNYPTVFLFLDPSSLPNMDNEATVLWQEVSQTETDHGHGGYTCVCQGEVGERATDGEFGVGRCRLLHLEQMGNEVLLYRTGSYVWSLGLEHDGK